MSRARGIVAVLALAVAGAAVPRAADAARPASASWSAPALASSNGSVQGSGFETALSADGGHVIFTTATYGLLPQPGPPGTYRVGGLVSRRLGSEAVELVAPGRLYDAVTDEPAPGGGGGASTPSVSADGTRVVFITRDGIDPADVNGRPDIYVRDMTRTLGAPDAFTLVSALDGSGAPVLWGGGQAAGARLTQAGGSLSDDGQRIVFVTDAPAVLEPGGPELPAGQVVVRDLRTRSTRVLTTAAGTGAPVGGARYASISGDGTAVAWIGTNGPAQATFAAGESLDPALPWVLWRPVGGNAADPAVRPAATGDPQVPGCALGQAGGPACAGRLDLGFETNGFPAPVALSRDGLRVAFVSTLRPVGAEQLNEFGQADAFLATLTPGRATAATVREITREGTSSASIENSSPIVGTGISGDGSSVAFTTARTRFRLSAPVFLGETPTAGVDLETYVADLRADTLELVTQGVGEVKAVGNAGGSDDVPKLSGSGTTVAFTSSARNLVTGDVNGTSDSFVVARATPPVAPPVALQDVPAPEAGAAAAPAYRLRVSIAAARDGSLRVFAVVPGPGALAVDLRRPASRASARRTVARAGGRARTAGLVALRVRPAASLRGRRSRSIRVDVVARFTPGGALFAGRRPLVRTIPTLLRVPAKRTGRSGR